LIAGTFLGGHVVTSGDLAVVDENKLLSVLIGRCQEQRAVLCDRCALVTLRWKANRVHAVGSRRTFAARLLIDTSGGCSPLAATFRLHKLRGFYAVYGAHLSPLELRGPEIIVAYVDHLGDPPPVLEVIPTANDAAHCVVFTCTKRLPSGRALRALFEGYRACNPFFRCTPNTVTLGEKSGAIPIGQLRRKGVPLVLPFGEAGMIHPPLLGTGFNAILDHVDDFCAYVAQLLSRGSIPEKADLSYHYPLLKQMQDRLQLRLAQQLIDGNVEALDALLRFVAVLPQETIYRICSNEMTWGEVVKVALRLPQSLRCCSLVSDRQP
jgi:hypothetical protein